MIDHNSVNPDKNSLENNNVLLCFVIWMLNTRTDVFQPFWSISQNSLTETSSVDNTSLANALIVPYRKVK